MPGWISCGWIGRRPRCKRAATIVASPRPRRMSPAASRRSSPKAPTTPRSRSNGPISSHCPCSPHRFSTATPTGFPSTCRSASGGISSMRSGNATIPQARRFSRRAISISVASISIPPCNPPFLRPRKKPASRTAAAPAAPVKNPPHHPRQLPALRLLRRPPPRPAPSLFPRRS